MSFMCVLFVEEASGYEKVQKCRKYKKRFFRIFRIFYSVNVSVVFGSLFVKLWEFQKLPSSSELDSSSVLPTPRIIMGHLT